MKRTQAPLSPKRIDLNLLRVFDAVFEDRNLLRAGKRLHLSQSAISHALARLREALQDELFVRTAKGMEPTARALAMATPLREAMRAIHDTLGVQPFDPATATRRFVVAANDYVTSVLLTRLVRRMGEAAPLSDLVVRPSTRLDLAEQIDVGRIDIALGIFADLPSRFQSARLWVQDDVLVFRRGHPLARRKPRIDDLAEFPLLTVSLGGQEEAGAVSGFIIERGLARQSEMFDRWPWKMRWRRPAGGRTTGSRCRIRWPCPTFCWAATWSPSCRHRWRRPFSPGATCWPSPCPTRRSMRSCAPSGISRAGQYRAPLARGRLSSNSRAPRTCRFVHDDLVQCSLDREQELVQHRGMMNADRPVVAAGSTVSSVVDAVVRSRRTVRAFRPTPVPKSEVAAILNLARCAPSNSNTQPWSVHVLEGEPKRLLSEALAQSHERNDLPPSAAFSERPAGCLRVAAGRFRCPVLRRAGDRSRRRGGTQQAVCAQSLLLRRTGRTHLHDRQLPDEAQLGGLRHVPADADDCRQGQGPGTCPQVSFVRYEPVIAKFLRLPSTQSVVCGMSLGYADSASALNKLRMPREPVENFSVFWGFEDVRG